ncbi:MAG: class I SAM-dependent rRNA methyltransferase [Phycisphaeraceae bacterium]|nr:class I SAM-dependent rRNA methyltransferase [Phycisphaeraceae bacterium]
MKPPTPSPERQNTTAFRNLLEKALKRRRPLVNSRTTQAFRVFSGEADGMDGVFVDVYAQGAVLIVYEGRAPRAFDPIAEAETVLRVLAPFDTRAVYFKPFAKDRSKMGGELPPIVTDPAPAAGEPLPESLLIREHDWNLEVRLYNGLSTGLFLDQRDNRKFIANWVRDRVRATGTPPAVLNTFAYTCAFSVAAAISGAQTASVDVSPRYLDWGKRNFEHNKLDPSQHRFARMDTFEFFSYAKRKNLKFDMIILDPPSFSAGSKKKGIRPWSSIADYARLVGDAAKILNPKGVLFASTNTQELCRPGRFEREIEQGLGRPARYLRLPDMPLDFAKDRERFTARAFAV